MGISLKGFGGDTNGGSGGAQISGVRTLPPAAIQKYYATDVLPVYGNTVFLMNFEDDSLVDEYGNTMIPEPYYTDPYADSSVVKFGTASGRFTYPTQITSPANDSFFMEGAPFTIETWFNVSSMRKQIIVDNWSDYQYNGWNMTVYADGSVQIIPNGNNNTTNHITSDAGLVTANTWHHIAWVWDGTSCKGFLDGILFGEKVTPPQHDETNKTFTIGGSYSSQRFDGWMDSFRISRTALYDADFELPTVPFAMT